jgi:hypothetical protein
MGKKKLRNKRIETKIKEIKIIDLDWRMKLKRNKNFIKGSRIKITNKKIRIDTQIHATKGTTLKF